jgi:hypothetical protein
VVAPTTTNEIHADDLRMAQAPAADFDNRSETIIPVDKPLEDDYAAALAFMEEPLTIRIEQSDEENAPVAVECWVNGKGAEVLNPITGKFDEINCLPIGGPIITKRKYVEVLARSRSDRVVATEVDNRPAANKDGWKVERRSLRKTLFSVIHDPNPKGHEWLTRLYAER